MNTVIRFISRVFATDTEEHFISEMKPSFVLKQLFCYLGKGSKILSVVLGELTQITHIDKICHDPDIYGH